MTKRTKTTLGWFLVGLGAIFLITGLVVMAFASFRVGGSTALGDSPLPSSIWVTVADRLMDFTLTLLSVDWTPTRVGVFFIIIGMILEGGGVYVMISKPRR